MEIDNVCIAMQSTPTYDVCRAFNWQHATIFGPLDGAITSLIIKVFVVIIQSKYSKYALLRLATEIHTFQLVLPSNGGKPLPLPDYSEKSLRSSKYLYAKSKRHLLIN